MLLFVEQVIEEHGEESTHYQRMIECEIKPRNAIPVTEEMLASNCGTFPSVGMIFISCN